jgi:hypothetical protein
MEPLLPNEIVGEILKSSGHKTTARLLGKGWKDLRTREELGEELSHLVTPEELLRYSLETGKDFVVYGRGLKYEFQIREESDAIYSNYFNNNEYHEGLFILTGNSEGLIELYSYRTPTGSHSEKKTSPISSFGKVFEDLVYHRDWFDYRDLVGVIYDDEKGYEEIVLKDAGLTACSILKNYCYYDRLPKYVWSDNVSIE